MFEARRQLSPGLWMAPARPETRVTRFIAKSGQRPVGFVELIRDLPVQSNAAGYRLHLLYVRTRYRRMGIGKRLISHALSLAQEEGVTALTLSVRESNQVAVELFVRLGFVRCSIPIPERSPAPEIADWIAMSINFSGTMSDKNQQLNAAA